jgi:hypothetical protein
VGANDAGQLGNGDTTDTSEFVAAALDGAQLIGAGQRHTCALKDGAAWCWGDNRAAQLAQPDLQQSSLPVRLDSAWQRAPHQLAVGDLHTCVLDQNVHGYCWGTADAGAVLPSVTQLPQVGTLASEFFQLGAGFTRVIREGRLYDVPWTPNAQGALNQTPGTFQGIVQNAIGPSHDCILKTSGSVWCQDGDFPAFYAVVADYGNDVAQIEVGENFDCARTRAGRVLCRGRNESGQLGDGSQVEQAVATPVLGIDSAVEISLGQTHACARLADGSVWCWGTLPGSEPRTIPEQLSSPQPAKPCSSRALPENPWGTLPTEPDLAATLGDARRAWGQNQCRCGLVDAEPLLESCSAEETRVLNGCLEAFHSILDESAQCYAQYSWDLAECSANCSVTGETLDSCYSEISRDCSKLPAPLAFCLRNSLGCDGALTENRVTQFETCDGKADCANAFDEANCRDQGGMFTCADGSRLTLQLVANAVDDCPDGSDEWLLQ